LVNILWKVILSECFCYIVLNVYLVSNWIKSGRLNTMVNKFTCLSRVYGILYVIGSGSEKTLDNFSNEAMSDLFCFLYNNFTKYTVYSYWISQLIIAIIRYIFVMYPIEVHNRMPDNESKNKLFKKILKCSFLLPVLPILIELFFTMRFNLVNDIFLQNCLTDFQGSFQLGQTMLSLVFWGLPYILFVSPCMIIYLRLMAFITYRPINKGLDPKRETVVRKKTNLMTAGETMNLIVITVLMGATQSVMYIAPALNIKMSLRVRLYTSCAIQIMVCLIETLETLIVQVQPSKLRLWVRTSDVK